MTNKDHSVLPLDSVYLEAIIRLSREDARRRRPTPLTSGSFSEYQALINAIQPGSYMQPHNHPDHSELWIHKKGRMNLVEFSGSGDIDEVYVLGDREIVGDLIPMHVVMVPPGVYHSAYAVESDSVFLNVSPGPFSPDSKIGADWAPSERDPETDQRQYLSKMQADIRDRVVKMNVEGSVKIFSPHFR